MRKDVLNAIEDLKGVKMMINKSELSRRFGCSINTVNKYLKVQNTDEKNEIIIPIISFIYIIYSIYLFTLIISPFPFTTIFISPSLSVLKTLAPKLINLLITSRLGCPNLLFFPTPTNIILGFTDSINSSVEEVFDPWWAAFKIVEFNISLLFLYSNKIFSSAIFSISPVNNTEKFL